MILAYSLAPLAPYNMNVGYENQADYSATLDIFKVFHQHYCDVIMGAVASQITSPTIVYSTVYSDTDERKHQSSASLAFVWEIHRGSGNSPHKWAVTRRMFSFDDVIMCLNTRCFQKPSIQHITKDWTVIIKHKMIIIVVQDMTSAKLNSLGKKLALMKDYIGTQVHEQCTEI